MSTVHTIHQIAPVFAYGDAIGNQMARMRELFRQWGYDSQVYAPLRDQRLADPGLPHDQYPSSPDNVLIYHYSTYTPLSDFVLRRPDRVILYYHNVTPPEFFRPYDALFAEKLARGKRDVARFKHLPLAWAVSEFNRQELLAAGFAQVRVVPPHISTAGQLLAVAQSDEAQQIVARYADGWVNWLFVGRLAPNKRQDDIIRAFAYYHRVINARSRLFLVGSDGGLPAYRFELQTLAARAAEHIYLPGAVSFEALAGYYRAASVFVSMSEHEGFGIPLIEAMHFDLPVISYKAAAIPDTLNGAGVLITAKNYAAIAEMVSLVVSDDALRRKILRGQQDRIQQLSARFTETALHEAVKALS